MASGWANDSAVQEQIDATIDDAIARARNQMTQGESAEFCDECGEAIPLARQKAIRGVRYCINCQEAIDKNIIPLVAIIAVVVKIANSDNEHTSYTKNCTLCKLTQSRYSLFYSINSRVKSC
ncbi:DnaK suppressor protein [Proteus mirabilis]|nr:DnaK suppressor protein [Proteus mirabilis]